MQAYSDMVKKLAKQGDVIAASLNSQKIHVWHMASALVGETGELIANEGVSNVVEELGDIEFYIEGVRGGLDISYESIPAIEIVDEFIDIDGIVIEACNIFDVCKKWIIYEKDLDTNKLLNAMSRLEHYLKEYRASHNLTREEVLHENMKKLAKRYGNDFVYTNLAAQERVDKQS